MLHICKNVCKHIRTIKNTGRGMNVSFEFYFCESRSICDELITRPEESNRVWGV